MTRRERIIQDAINQEQLFGTSLKTPQKDNRTERDDMLRINQLTIEECVATARRFPDGLHISEFRPPHARLWHFCVGSTALALCGKVIHVKSENRRAKSLSEILRKTSVDCDRCRMALGLPRLGNYFEPHPDGWGPQSH